MNRILKSSIFATLSCLVICLSTVTPSVAALPVLNGATVFGTDSTGNFAAQAYATGAGFNLYFDQGGSFLNAPNGSINIPLALGLNTFDIYGEGDTDVAFYGSNLMFDGHTTAPDTSVFAPIGTTGTPTPAFSPNSATTTFTVTNVAPGSGQVTYSTGDYLVTLQEYYWQSPSVQNVNLVSGFLPTPGGNNDFTGRITLNVTAITVPEPSTLALLGLAVSVAAIVRRRKA